MNAIELLNAIDEGLTAYDIFEHTEALSEMCNGLAEAELTARRAGNVERREALTAALAHCLTLFKRREAECP